MNNPHELEIEAAATAILESAYARIVSVEPQLRRFAQAMADLGAPVPDGWARQDSPEAVTFGALTPAQFDRLLCLLEDLAAGRAVNVTVLRGGPSLLQTGAPAGPSASPITSIAHMVVPQ